MLSVVYMISFLLYDWFSLTPVTELLSPGMFMTFADPEYHQEADQVGMARAA